MENLTSTVELVLYYLCTLVVCQQIMGNTIVRKRMMISLLCFIPLPFISFMGDKMFLLGSFSFTVVGIVLARWTAKGSSLSVIIYTRFFLSFLAVLLCSFAIGMFSLDFQSGVIFEMFVNPIVSAALAATCFSGKRYKLQMMNRLTPRFIKILLLVILFVCALLSILIIQGFVKKENPLIIEFAKYLCMLLIPLILIVVLVVVLYSTTNRVLKNQADSLEKQLEIQAQYYSHLAEVNLTMRRFRHDYRNIQIGLKKLLSENKTDEALTMLDEQPESTAGIVHFDTGCGIVDAILEDKQKWADEHNTVIIFNGAVPEDIIKPTDLCIVFGHPLDNAVEACTEINPEQKKEIHISFACNSGFFFMEVTNPVKNKVMIHGQLPFTTKHDKEMHGFGLYSLQQTVRRYNGTVSCECNDERFKLTVNGRISSANKK